MLIQGSGVRGSAVTLPFGHIYQMFRAGYLALKNPLAFLGRGQGTCC